MKKCLMVHADIYAFGGAELYAIRVIALLQRRGYEVTVCHCGGEFDADRIERWSGIALDPSLTRFITAAKSRLFAGRSLSLLRYALALRHAMQFAFDYDLVIGSYGECKLPAQESIEIIHVPIFASDLKSLRHVGFRGGRFAALLRRGYVAVSRCIAGHERHAASSKVSVCNSAWTLRQLQACYPGSNGVVIYPGAETLNEPTVQDLVSWSRRKNKIVMLGRVVEAKNVHLGIQLVQELRVVSSDVELVIIGNGQGKYAKRIEELVATCSYVTWHRGLSRGQLEELVVDCKWGLHCAEYEHYGIAALELQRLGCITLVPNSCGQAEIALPDLRYVGIDDAIAKYTRLFSMPDEDLARMHEERTRMVHAHSVEQFYDSFEKLLP